MLKRAACPAIGIVGDLESAALRPEALPCRTYHFLSEAPTYRLLRYTVPIGENYDMYKGPPVN